MGNFFVVVVVVVVTLKINIMSKRFVHALTLRPVILLHVSLPRNILSFCMDSII